MANPEHVKLVKQGIDPLNEWRKKNPLTRLDLSGANLVGANLLTADLSRANLIAVDLAGARLMRAKLRWADLSSANLRRANLLGADLSGAELSGADLTNANVGTTVFAANDLRHVQGLNTLVHHGPSTIGIDTIYLSGGNIPEVFLREAGCPDIFITYVASLVGKPTEFYSCFISYSTKDQEFADRLHNDLKANGVNCWYARKTPSPDTSSPNRSTRRSACAINSC